jgi:epoxyqueuosine reductase
MYERAITEWAYRRGYRASWGPASLLGEVMGKLEGLSESGSLDPGFVRGWINWFFQNRDLPLDDAKSLIVVAVPRPTHSVAFETSAGRIDALLPPTYVGFSRTIRDVRDDLRNGVFRDGGGLEICTYPVKSIATRIGLAKYGRNNITYVEGMGSYHELVCLLTDVELRPEDGMRLTGPQPLAECEDCDRCIRSCPTAAIPRDRFLINAARCLTNYNESEGPFPRDVPPSAHHCLIGCLVCQRVCPINKRRYRVEDTGLFFDRDETEILLSLEENRDNPAAAAVRAKFERLGMSEDPLLMGRNLRALIEKHRGRVKRAD